MRPLGTQQHPLPPERFGLCCEVKNVASCLDVVLDPVGGCLEEMQAATFPAHLDPFDMLRSREPERRPRPSLCLRAGLGTVLDECPGLAHQGMGDDPIVPLIIKSAIARFGKAPAVVAPSRAPSAPQRYADSEVVCDALDLAAIEQLGATHPGVKIKLLENLSLCLCRRLRLANRKLSVFE